MSFVLHSLSTLLNSSRTAACWTFFHQTVRTVFCCSKHFVLIFTLSSHVVQNLPLAHFPGKVPSIISFSPAVTIHRHNVTKETQISFLLPNPEDSVSFCNHSFIHLCVQHTRNIYNTTMQYNKTFVSCTVVNCWVESEAWAVAGQAEVVIHCG